MTRTEYLYKVCEALRLIIDDPKESIRIQTQAKIRLVIAEKQLRESEQADADQYIDDILRDIE